MDILNFISWTKNGRTVSTVDGANTLVPLGFKDPKRDDGYLAGSISVDNLLASIPLPPSVIGITGTSLYSTNPLAGPINPDNNIALGSGAGTNATNAFASVLLGTQTGNEATNIVFSNFIGNATGGFAINVVNSNFIGNSAGYNAPNASQSNFFGFAAGNNAVSANNSNFIGQNAGTNAALANNSNFLGKEAGMNSSGNNVNAFGNQAHKGGSLSGQTVFANATLPSYVNRAAATTAINVPNGAVAGSTYLYYNQTTFAIEAVRL